ncbi:uncharacterized protein RMCB_5221 [Mycolicibacterium brisbanense]|uniref:Uncharacterized protein n=1 Tax=Mycolicibacterium brisbanense TaxID=146020 RepID=A0A124E0N9_9MYCO|nr:uncharacterized protein RMCB_5221 [Mycolicibacterium brisbanense]
MHAADPIVAQADSLVIRVSGHMPDRLGPESVVSEEDVADTGYQYSGRGVTGYMRRIFR